VTVVLRARGTTYEFGGGRAPWLMGIVNATPDSFSDGAEDDRSLAGRVALARSLAEAGATVIDVGGESGRTDRDPVGPGTESERVVPVISAIARELPEVLISVDTFEPAVATAAIEAGAAIVNDVSGLRNPELADVCAATGAALVLMHTVAPPKTKLLDHGYGDVAAEVRAFLDERIELAVARGVAREQLILDPGPDFSKSPAQTIATLRHLPALTELGRPLLLAVSRKDFVGALTNRRPRERLAGTLAALAHGLDMGGNIFRMHDVREAADFIAVWRALRGEVETEDGLALSLELRHEPPAPSRPTAA
jgi:dihydropteroate synthase